ncbi:hypothetical protein [Oricola cellulosilytica]|uniref:Uncharacterized protein n=1 Tax=Oricola cellulosilytica TaxID=1429082 RepID=A0A4R0PFV2_9HYPH|nr:hypothetical protein [Oricola cellulosilytica]TCD15295.1 hypothetical protein E0D97_07095 [Oricola cellulosilytica]
MPRLWPDRGGRRKLYHCFCLFLYTQRDLKSGLSGRLFGTSPAASKSPPPRSRGSVAGDNHRTIVLEDGSSWLLADDIDLAGIADGDSDIREKDAICDRSFLRPLEDDGDGFRSVLPLPLRQVSRKKVNLRRILAIIKLLF